MKVLFPLALILAGCGTTGFGAKTEPVTVTASNVGQTVGRTQGAATSIGVSSNTYNVYVAGMDQKVAAALANALEGVPSERLPETIAAITAAFKAAGVTVNVNPGESPSSVDNAGLGGEGSTQPINEPPKPE